MRLKSTAKGIEGFSELKHFSWDQVAEFAEIERWNSSYSSGGSGDWKKSKEGADGYLMVTVGEMPYWADAVGQIPFAVDVTTDNLESHGDAVKAVQETLASGQSHSKENIILSTPDRSNTYDNHMILRGAIWATQRYEKTGQTTIFGYQILKNTGFSPVRLSDTLGIENAHF